MGLGSLKLVVFPSVVSSSLESAAVAFVPQGPGLVLMGGKTDVTDAFRWMQQTLMGEAKGVGGDLVVLTAKSDNFRDAEIAAAAPFSSVRTIRIDPEASAAELARAGALISEAHAVFMGGGNQANYLGWAGTPVQKAIQGVYDKGGVVGGTSAGLAVLGEHVFAARDGGVGPQKALLNPGSASLALAHDFLEFPPMKGTLTDTHFAERDRLGRLIAMMAGQLQAGTAGIRGIGVDEGAALVINGKGVAQVLKEGSAPGGAHFVSMGASDFTPFTPAGALTATAKVQHVLTSAPFSLDSPPSKPVPVRVEAGKMRVDVVTRYGWSVAELEE